jgi:hypothetical protein
MKKLLLTLICLTMIIFCVGCSDQGNHNAQTTDPNLQFPEGTVYVTTADELIDAFKNLKTGDHILLGADIDMTGKDFAPIKFRPFTFDGNGHVISNYHKEGSSALLVEDVGNAKYTISNLTFKNCSVSNLGDHAALFVGRAREADSVTLINCHAVDCTVKGMKYASIFISYTASIDVGTGELIPMTIKDCSVDDCTVEGGGSTGFAIGHSGGNDLTQNIIENLTVKNSTVIGPDATHEGIVVGTAGRGETIISGVKVENVTTTHNESEGVRSYYGRHLSNMEKGLVIDGTKIEKTQ